MATRYNAFGWYNPYAPVNGGGVVNSGQQPLRGLVVPTTSELAWRVEPDINRGYPEVRNDAKLYAATPQMAATTTTTTTTTNGANNQTTAPTTADQLTSVEKSRFRGVGLALCILASFTLGIVVSYFAVDVSNECLHKIQRTSTDPVEQFYYWAPRVAPIPMALFAFVIGILSVVIRDRAGGQARTIYALSIFSFVLLLPLLAAGGIGGVLEAKDCISGLQIVYLVLPSILVLMFLIFFGLLIYVIVLLIRAKPVTPLTATVAPTSTTTSVTMMTTPVQPTVQPAPTQPPQQQQPTILQVAGQPAYRPLPPPQPYQPYQYVVRRYPAPRPPPIFGAAPYRRLPMRSPSGYNGYSPFQPMRPYSYY